MDLKTHLMAYHRALSTAFSSETIAMIHKTSEAAVTFNRTVLMGVQIVRTVYTEKSYSAQQRQFFIPLKYKNAFQSVKIVSLKPASQRVALFIKVVFLSNAHKKVKSIFMLIVAKVPRSRAVTNSFVILRVVKLKKM